MKSKEKTYSEKLKDPRWQKLRLEILQRDEFCCRICGDGEETLHVHHRCYRRGAEPWDYDPRELIAFCEKCHKEFEDLFEKLKFRAADDSALWNLLRATLAFLESKPGYSSSRVFGEAVAMFLYEVTDAEAEDRGRRLQAVEDSQKELIA